MSKSEIAELVEPVFDGRSKLSVADAAGGIAKSPVLAAYLDKACDADRDDGDAPETKS
jgi:hypothetical protein